MDILETMQDNMKLIIGVAILVLLTYGFYSYSTNKYTLYDRMTNGAGATGSGSGKSDSAHASTDVISSADSMKATTTLNAHDLLPKNEKNKWTTLNPITQNSMTIPDVMQSDFFIGINTTGTSKKNPNLQGIGREDPVIAKLDTSGQFNISSIDTR
jgi:hypothetical protein